VKPKIYIETSIPSFYFEERTAAEMIAQRNWTRMWWDEYSSQYEVVTSIAVLEELEDGDYPNKKEVLALMKDIPVLNAEEEVREIVKTYIKHKAMPNNPTGDALHLAIASFYQCRFLLTWNCNHLANPNKKDHLVYVNNKMGLFTPQLVTPFQLLGGKNNAI